MESGSKNKKADGEGAEKKKADGEGADKTLASQCQTVKSRASQETMKTGMGEAEGETGTEKVEYRGPKDLSLEAFVEKYKKDGAKTILNEFRALKKANQGIKNHTTRVFEANALRNRYKDVGCWDQTRVVLKGGGRDYIHANWVDGALKRRQFIATQGPLEQVAGQMESTTGDFWQMVWDEQVAVIVMLCLTEEQGKAKCAQYWPLKQGERQQYGPVSVETKDVGLRKIKDHEITVTTLELLKDGFTNTRSLVHFLHGNWPDRKCPPSAYPIVEFVIRCHTAQKRVCENNDLEADESPIVVHCSAGIGRSGTFLAIDVALGVLNRYSALNVAEVVRRIRTQRHFAVQTPVQYVCVYQAILEFLAKHKNIPFDTQAFAKQVALIK